MEKVKIDKLECQFPLFFKSGWLAIVLWLVLSIVNAFFQIIEWHNLDSLGFSSLLLFSFILYCSFSDEVKEKTDSRGNVSIPVFLVSLLIGWLFYLMLITEIAISERLASPCVVIFQLIAIAFACIVCSLMLGAFLNMAHDCLWIFAHTSGRFKRILVEVIIAIGIICGFPYTLKQGYEVLTQSLVVVVAVAFLYDIWRIAEFPDIPKMEQVSKMVKILTEE